MPHAAVSTFGPINLEQSSQFDVPERQDLVGVLLETLTVVDDALRERIEIFDLFRPCVRENLLESVVVLVLLFTFEVTITAKLHKNLVICHRSSVSRPGQFLHCVFAGLESETYLEPASCRSADTCTQHHEDIVQ